VPDLVNPFFPAVVSAVEDALHHSGMSLFLCDANDSPRSKQSGWRRFLPGAWTALS